MAAEVRGMQLEVFRRYVARRRFRRAVNALMTGAWIHKTKVVRDLAKNMAKRYGVNGYGASMATVEQLQAAATVEHGVQMETELHAE